MILDPSRTHQKDSGLFLIIEQYEKLNQDAKQMQIKYLEMKQKYDEMNEKMQFLNKVLLIVISVSRLSI